MATGRAGRIAVRVLRVIGLTLAGVVGLVGLAYAALTLTPTGRATIRTGRWQAVPNLSTKATIPGKRCACYRGESPLQSLPVV